MAEPEIDPAEEAKIKAVIAQKKRVKTLRKAFDAIALFVEQLWEVFETSKAMKPLENYRTIVQNVRAVRIDEVEKIVAGFDVFFNAYDEFIIDGDIDEIPQTAKIDFGLTGKIYLEVGIFLRRKSVGEACLAHLRTISTILKPNKEKIKQLEEQEIENSAETRYLKEFMTKAKDRLEGVDISDGPGMILKVAQSGLLQDIMSSVKSGTTEDGEELNPQKLMQSMQHLMGGLMSDMPGAKSKKPSKGKAKRAKKAAAKAAAASASSSGEVQSEATTPANE